MKKLYLYDPRYNLKTETTYKKLEDITGSSIQTLRISKSKKLKVKKLWYIIDDKTTKRELYEYYSQVNYNNEAWKEVHGSDGKYLVSNFGRFKRYKNENELEFLLPYFRKRSSNTSTSKHGQQYVRLQFRSEVKEYSVARLVAYHFIDIFEKDSDVNNFKKEIRYKDKVFDELVVIHKNNIQYDNYHANLELLDRADAAKRVNKTCPTARSIVVYDAKTGVPIEHFNSIERAARELKISPTTISNNLKGTYSSNVVLNKYIFKYEDDFEVELQKHNDSLRKILDLNTPVALVEANTGEIIESFSSISKASRELKICKKSISKYLDIEYDTTTKLYRDKYVFKTLNEDEVSELFIEPGIPLKFNEINRNTICNNIYITDLQTNSVIGKFKSVDEAAKAVNLHKQTIQRHINFNGESNIVNRRYIVTKLDNIDNSNNIVVIDTVELKVIGSYNNTIDISKLIGIDKNKIDTTLDIQNTATPISGRYVFNKITINKNCIVLAIDAEKETLIGKYDSISKAAKDLSISDWTIREFLKNGTDDKPVKKKYIFRKVEVNGTRPLYITHSGTKKFIGTFNTFKEAANHLGYNPTALEQYMYREDTNLSFKGKYNIEFIF